MPLINLENVDLNSIHYRQDAVENLIDDDKFMFQIQTILLHFTDVERTTRRMRRRNLIGHSFRNYSRVYSRKSLSNSNSRGKTNNHDQSTSTNFGHFTNIETSVGTSHLWITEKSLFGREWMCFGEEPQTERCLGFEWSTFSSHSGYSQCAIDNWTNSVE